QGLDHVMRPLALHLGVQWLVSNRLDFRDRVATGRLLAPVIRPRGLFARITGAGPDGRREPKRLVRELNLSGDINALAAATNPAGKRFERMIEESPVFDSLYERYGSGLPRFLRNKIEVVEGDLTQAELGLAPEIAGRLRHDLDLIINSSGLTDFNPDLRDALL